MSINDQMNDLGRIGAGGYVPSDDMVSTLLTRTRRARAVRHGSTAIVGSVGAVVLSVLAVQVVSATDNDPALQDDGLADDGLLNDGDDIAPVVKDFNDIYGDDIPTKIHEPVDLTPIIEKLEAAAQREADEAAAKKAEEEAAAKKKAADEAAAAKKKESDASKDSTYDKKKAQWSVEECEAKHSYDDYEGKYLDCDKNQWFAKPGYILFDGVHKIGTWTDAATGKQYYGVPFPHYSKVAIAASLDATDVYWHYTNDATWDGTTCNGVTKTVDDKTMRQSCKNQDEWYQVS
jgi:hypothetical protein